MSGKLSWDEFRTRYCKDVPEWLDLADYFEAAGLELLNFSSHRIASQLCASLTITNGRDSYMIEEAEDGLILMRIERPGKEMTRISLPAPRPGQSAAEVIVEVIWCDSLR
ncbi:MAG: hypothetical protein WB586_03360 [Chthoniobacterales bacterium]